MAILVREYYFDTDEDGTKITVYTGRDTVCPVDGVDNIRRWADNHIPNWQNISLFTLTYMPVFFGKEPAE